MNCEIRSIHQPNITVNLKVLFFLGLGAVIAIPTPSFAGGDSWKVRVQQMQLRSADRATVVLQASEYEQSSGNYYGKCPKMLVEVDFRPHYPPEQRHFNPDHEKTTRRKHQDALIWLQTNYQHHTPIRFGEMIGGLAPKSWLDLIIQYVLGFFGKASLSSATSDIPASCQFVAPGLKIVKEQANQEAVYVLNDFSY
jgi:hypothetical protein